MSREKQSQYDRMTGQPVEKLILELGLPTTISMLVTNLYNMADTYFVGTLGTSASGATGVVFGLMAILQALGFMSLLGLEDSRFWRTILGSTFDPADILCYAAGSAMLMGFEGILRRLSRRTPR